MLKYKLTIKYLDKSKRIEEIETAKCLVENGVLVIEVGDNRYKHIPMSTLEYFYSEWN